MRPMDRYLAKIKSAGTDIEIELIIQEVYELGFDKGKSLVN